MDWDPIECPNPFPYLLIQNQKDHIIWSRSTSDNAGSFFESHVTWKLKEYSIFGVEYD